MHNVSLPSRTRSSVALVVDAQILMVRANDDGVGWVLPGIDLEAEQPAEAHLAGAVRALTGYDVRLDGCLYQGQREHGLYACFRGTLVGGGINAAAGDTIGWLPLTALQEHPEVQCALLHRPEVDYDLVAPVRVGDGEITGGSNTVYMVESADERFIWKQFHPVHPPASIDYETDLCAFLNQANLSFVVPPRLETRWGATRTLHDGAWRSLMPFIEGQSCADQRLEHFTLRGCVTAEFHEALRRYPMTPRPGHVISQTFFAFPPPPIDPFALTPAMIGVPSTPDNEALCGWFREQAQELNAFCQTTFSQLPRTICHNDLGANNIIVVGDDARAVIDWEVACPMPRVFDQATGLWIPTKPWHDPAPWNYIEAFVRGYSTFSRIESAEIAALPTTNRLRRAMVAIWWMGRDGKSVMHLLEQMHAATRWLQKHGDQLMDVVAETQR